MQARQMADGVPNGGRLQADGARFFNIIGLKMRENSNVFHHWWEDHHREEDHSGSQISTWITDSGKLLI